MYKAGKKWVFVMLSTVALTGIMVMSGNIAKADAVAQSSTEQVAKIDTTSATTTSTQATAQVEKATNNVNESNAAQTSATTTTTRGTAICATWARSQTQPVRRIPQWHRS